MNRAQQLQERRNFAAIKEALIPWLGDVLRYYRADFWRFDSVAGGSQVLGPPPAALEVHTLEPAGVVRFRVPQDLPSDFTELSELRGRGWHVCSVALIATVGIRATNTLLQKLRHEHGLPRIPRSASWAAGGRP